MPWLLFLLFSLSIIAGIKKKWIPSVILLIVVLVVNWMVECVPFRLWPLSEHNNGKILKILSFNMNGTEGDLRKKATGVASLVDGISPDVVFLTEFCENEANTLDSLLKKTLPYSTRSKKSRFSYFYSKYPLSESKHLMDSVSQKRIGVYTCEVYFEGDTIVLYGCHLPSNNYTKGLKNLHPDNIEDGNDLLEYMKDVNFASDLRAQHVDAMVNDMCRKSRLIVVMGDMNDIGGSATIRRIEACGLKDCWWQGGCGYGATIHRPLPYRIDHEFYSDGLVLQKIDIVDSDGLSDHDALYAEFLIENG